MEKSDTKSGFAPVSPKVDVNALELAVLDFWHEQDIFTKSLEAAKGKPLFTFYDGPPYATGKPHYGHVLQSAIKDTVLRYKTMQGYYVPRRVGWDTHGLPIENIVEKELGIKTKKEIEDDIEAFNNKCREVVYRYIDEFTATLKRLGRWAQYDNAYSTLDRDYMESEWWVFKNLWDQGLVYKAYRSTPYCIRCATPLSNFEVSSSYKNKTDMTVYALLPVVGKDNTFLLIWTTTPWTLPANVAVAINPDIEYVTAEINGKSIIIAKNRVEKVLGKEAVVTCEWQIDDLLHLKYEPLFLSRFADDEKEKVYGVVSGEHVTDKDGTGLVHMAPAFGEEDYEVGKKNGLPALRTVDAIGNFTQDVEFFAGRNIFDANADIMQHLKDRGLLWRKEQYVHSYPFCWRCDTPLIYYALDTWFVKVSELKASMLKTNEEIHWIPEHVKHGRFGKGIESAPDWAVSRNRFWSVPVPVWQCEKCYARVCVGSVEELQLLSGASGDAVKDIHRPYVDDISWPCKECGSAMKRIPEVLDVWFDSGSMPYSQWHYPFENKDFVEKGFPADFIAESIEMTRAWFYVLHVLSAALTKQDIGLGTQKPAFKNVIGSGIIFAEDGQKLSKKLKNYPEIQPVLETYGADVLRFYLLSSSSLGEPYKFSERDMRQVQRNVYLTLWNVYSFFVGYANVHEWTKERYMPDKKSEHFLDVWMLNRTSQLEQEVMTQTDDYHIDTASRLFIAYIDDLSNWYVRRSRSRFQRPEADTERDEAFGTLYEVLVRVSVILAPFMPFVSEEIFRALTGKESVHLESLPEKQDNVIDVERVETMRLVRQIVSEGLALRARGKMKVRQPLAALYVASTLELNPELQDIIKEEVNVKELVITNNLPAGEAYIASKEDANVQAALDIALTPQLKAEGVARDIIRTGQTLRREAQYGLDDRITLIISSEDAGLMEIVGQQKEIIQDALQADEIASVGEEDAGLDLTLAGMKLHIGTKKA